MERFVRRENVKHYRELLKMAKDEAERQKIQAANISHQHFNPVPH